MNSVLKTMQNKDTYTENGALSNSTTMSSLLDYFSKVGTYNKRDQSEVDLDMSKIFSEDDGVALKLVFASRLITRKPTDFTDVQTGMGRKDEFYKAIVWLHNHRPNLLYNNLHLIPVFGCWKDFLTEPLIDVLNKQEVYKLFGENLENQLLRKYLPQQRTGKNVRSARDGKRSAWAGGFATYLGISPREYRKLKSEGAAHVFQKQMTSQQWDKINFNGIPGRAMTQFIARTGKDGKNIFERHNLVAKLTDWVLTQKDVKFNGYPHELTKAALASKRSFIQNLVFDKQFENLLSKIGDTKLGNVLCALDTSGSMTWTETNGVTPLDVCISLGMVFSSLNLGHFKDHVVSFNATSTLVKLTGNFTDRLTQAMSCGGWGNTNFQSVIDLIVKTRRENPSIPVQEFPETLLVVSDMAMDGAGNNQNTNYEVAMKKLHDVGLASTKIIWWNVSERLSDFPSQMDDKGVYMISGFDPIMLKALLGLADSTKSPKSVEDRQEETPLDGMMNVLSQPIFNLIQGT